MEKDEKNKILIDEVTGKISGADGKTFEIIIATLPVEDKFTALKEGSNAQITYQALCDFFKTNGEYSTGGSTFTPYFPLLASKEKSTFISELNSLFYLDNGKGVVEVRAKVDLFSAVSLVYFKIGATKGDTNFSEIEEILKANRDIKIESHEDLIKKDK